jgi:hypothetical protein
MKWNVTMEMVYCSKLKKTYSHENGENSNFKVISLCNEVDVVNEFIDQYFLDVESISTISTHPIEKKIPKPVRN